MEKKAVGPVETRYSVLKRRLAAREPVTMANLMLTLSPFMIDAVSDADCVLLDKEHGLYGNEELVPMTMRCREKGLPSIVRVEDSAYHLIAKAIDMGADGIMLPRTESVEQLRVCVEAMRFAPRGRTGFGGWGLLRDGEELEDFQEGRLLLPQIESPKGLSGMRAMLDRYGDEIDGFMIGPNDFSIMLGVPRQLDHPRMLESIRQVFDICREYGKSCGCFAGDVRHALLYREMGANIFWVGDDLSYMRAGLQGYLDALR